MTELALFHARVRDLVHRAPVTCAATASAAAVAALLSCEQVGSVIVCDDEGGPLGIVTDRDLRAKVVAAGRSPETSPAHAIMSSPLVSVRPGAFAFEALLAMLRGGIRHLAVQEGPRLVGVVSSRDLLALQAVHPVVVARDIARAPSLDALARLSEAVTTLVASLVTSGAAAHDVGQLVAELNDRIVLRVLGLSEDALAARGLPRPALGWAWLAFGSEGRREQTLRTDQDNGLVYADPPPGEAPAAAAYFAGLAHEVIGGLVAVGVPRCPGDFMASNPRWCQPFAVWAGYFRGWIRQSDPAALLRAAIHFDLRPLAGAAELASALTTLVHAEAAVRRTFLGLLARDVVERRPPLTVLGRIAVRRREPGRGTVDLKGGASLALVGAGRVLALELAVAETNTVERLRAAGAHGVFTEAETREATDAVQHLARLRLVHQLERLRAGLTPDNDVDPRRLSRADALLLRDALGTVGRVQAALRARFATHLLG